MLELNFKKATTKEHLLEYIGVSEELFDKIMKFTPHNNKTEKKIVLTEEKINLERLSFKDEPIHLNLPSLFTRHLIPKKSYKALSKIDKISDLHREVWEASEGLGVSRAYKTLNRRFSNFLASNVKNFPHLCSFGFIKGRNILQNAQMHCRKKTILHADIKDFFPSITKDVILKRLIEIGINDVVSDLLAVFLTIEGKLPQGLHTSPIISNLVFYDVDNKLEELARKYDCVYTRYADDMTFSSNQNLPSKEEINLIIREYGFSLSQNKCFISKLGQSHFVTGLSVSDSERPHIPKKMKRRLRQELYYCKKYGIRNHIYKAGRCETTQGDINRIDGMVRYISYIEKLSLPHLSKEWNELLQKDNLYPSYDTSQYIINPENIFIYFDETVLTYKKKQYLAICACIIVGTENREDISKKINQVLDDYLASPFKGNDRSKENLKKERLHRCVADQELKTIFQDYLKEFPYEAYVFVKEIQNKNYNEDDYLSLIKLIVMDRMIKLRGNFINMIFEQNSKIKEDNLKYLIERVEKYIKSDNEKFQIKTTIQIGNKINTPEISLPDFCVGIFKDYVEKKGFDSTKQRNFEEVLSCREFEGIRDKIILICDIDNKKVFNRKRPFTHDAWKHL